MVLLDEVGQHLGVGRRLEAVAGRDQFVGQLVVVLDDPVVDDGHPAGAVDMGVGVLSVGRPWVAHRVWPMPAAASPGGVLRLLVEIVEGAGAVGGTARHRPAAVGPTSATPGRVVTAVLEASQPLEQDLEHVVGSSTLGRGLVAPTAAWCPGDADDAAHGRRG
jgi:hypothetical protein